MARTDEQLRSTRPTAEPAPAVTDVRPATRPAVDVAHVDAIVAIIVYALVAWILARLVWPVLGETRFALRSHASSVATEAP